MEPYGRMSRRYLDKHSFFGSITEFIFEAPLNFGAPEKSQIFQGRFFAAAPPKFPFPIFYDLSVNMINIG